MTGLARSLYDDGERRTLVELQTAKLPHCTPEAIGVSFLMAADVADADRAGTEAAQRDATSRLAEYLGHFLPPGPCVMCGAALGGLFGLFEWGLAHGEGRCSRCSYPARGIHYVKLGDCGELTLPAILQYHPEETRDATD